MKFIQKYFYLIILSAALLLGVVGAAVIGDVPLPQRSLPEVAWPEFHVASPGDSRSERVTIYDAGDGNCYVFLPSYAQLDRITATAGKGKTYTLGGVTLSEGLNCGSFCLETPYAFTANGQTLGNLWFRRSENIPAVYVDTISGNLKGILHDTFPEELASARVYTAGGELDHLEDYAAIKCRGYSSWLLDKKSYALSLGKSTGLLGMGNSEKWTLTANGYDPTQLRNIITYTLANQIAPHSAWVPECAFTELYLNGEYMGLYLLCQKPDAGPDHMNLPVEDYYFEILPAGRRVNNTFLFDFCASTAAEIKFPKECTEEQAAFLKAKLEEFHGILTSEEENQWQDYIDMDSWVRKYLLEEVFGNVDGGFVSTFFHYDTSEGKYYVGHCWDYDLVFGGPFGSTWKLPNSMMAKRDWSKGSSWFGALYQKEVFLNAVKELYVKEYRPLLMENAQDTVEEFASQISRVIQSEYLRWPQLHKDTDWESAVELLLAFVDKRIAFLDALWLENETFYEIRYSAKNSNMYVSAGMPAEGMPKNIENPEGTWYLEGTDIPFDVTQPITGNVRLSTWAASETPPLAEEVTEADPAPERGYSIQDYITFLSIAALGMLLLLFVCVDIFRRKDRQKSEQNASHSSVEKR